MSETCFSHGRCQSFRPYFRDASLQFAPALASHTAGCEDRGHSSSQLEAWRSYPAESRQLPAQVLCKPWLSLACRMQTMRMEDHCLPWLGCCWQGAQEHGPGPGPFLHFHFFTFLHSFGRGCLMAESHTN